MIGVVAPRITYSTRGDVDDTELSELHRTAFRSEGSEVTPWREQLDRYSLSWIQAHVDAELVGFVNVSWDGGAHAFVLDTAVHPDHQHRGIGTELVRRATAAARSAGCAWLHVDYEPNLEAFYLASCGFRPTAAGLRKLSD